MCSSLWRSEIELLKVYLYLPAAQTCGSAVYANDVLSIHMLGQHS